MLRGSHWQRSAPHLRGSYRSIGRCLWFELGRTNRHLKIGMILGDSFISFVPATLDQRNGVREWDHVSATVHSTGDNRV
jgi:hypothetical protein